MKSAFLFSIFLSVCTLQAQQTYLHCGKLVDVEKEKILSSKTIIVSGNTISAIKDGFEQPTAGDVIVIDLKDKVVLPGFIDMHVHIESQFDKGTYINRFIKNEADVALEATKYARNTLMAGFTTVRDLGGTGVNVSLRNAINRGFVEGPRIFTAEKAIGTTGGHADPTNGMKQDLMGDPGPRQGVANSPEEAREAVRHRYKNGADVIKITATGGVLSVAKSGQNPQFTVEEIKAIVETSNDYGMLTAAHAHGDEGMRRAIVGGIKTIEHGTLMEEETMQLMIAHNTFLVPTISAGKQVTKKAIEEPGFFPAVVAEKAKKIGPISQKTFAKAFKKGVPIAFGTDAGVFPHGMNAIEFRYMTEVGMPVMEALRSATITNAELLGMKDNLGQLKVGYLADIVAVAKNPQDDVTTLEKVVFVMKDGKVYKQ